MVAPGPYPGPFVYSIANDFPGGQFTDAISNSLETLIEAQITSATLSNIGSDGTSVTITFSGPISAADKATLDGNETGPAGGLIAESCWTLSMTYGESTVTDGETISQTADGIESISITLQLLDGTGTSIAGNSNVVQIQADGFAPISALSVTLDDSGSASFTVGPDTDRGDLQITIVSGAIPQRNFTAQFA